MFVFLLLAGAATSFAQTANDYLLWNATRRLRVDDFAMKTKQSETTSSFGQFTVDYEVGGFSFFTRNFNQKVHNYFLRNASWIDTTSNLLQTLRYQQTLFDLCEIYTRQFRRALRENRKQFLKGTDIAKALNSQYMSEFAKRRVAYDGETRFGTDGTAQKQWEAQIQKELAALDANAYEK